MSGSLYDDLAESRSLRVRQSDLEDEYDRPQDEPEDGAAAELCKTVAVGTYPTVAGRTFAVAPIDPDGDEVEGATPTFTDVSDRVFFAIHLGTTAPPVGSRVIVEHSGGRATFVY
ncbi:unnamed protein product [Phaeothamnion confervicola]